MPTTRPIAIRPTPPQVAAAWLADPMCVILDFETTSLKGYAVELAVIDMRGQPRFNGRFNPGVPIEPAAFAVHGLSLDVVKHEPPFAECIDSIAAAVAGKKVIAYNSKFDAGIFFNEQKRLVGKEAARIQPAEWLCAMLLYSEHVGEPGRYEGEYRWQKLPGGDHSALGDALACLKTLQKMAALAGRGTPVVA